MTTGATQLPQPGDRIGGRYRIEHLLGEGGMGAVYAAVNEMTGRAVAIKWLLPAAARSKEAVRRFVAEARATAKIEHPNVISVLDVGQDQDAPFLVMERLRGESLAERLRRGRMSPAEVLMVMIPACRGVAEAHKEGVIHRDLKPDNIFLCVGKDGSPREPKVLDFGISKLFDTEGPALTRTGMTMGTPQYMSPEQLNATQDPDPRLDVYSAGVVLYEALAGQPPYRADGLFELVQQIAAGNPPLIRSFAPEVSPDLEAVVLRAMNVHASQRFANMDELVAELVRVQPTASSGVGAPGPFGPPTRGGAPTTGPMDGPPVTGAPPVYAPGLAPASAPTVSTPAGSYGPAPVSSAPFGPSAPQPASMGALTPGPMVDARPRRGGMALIIIGVGVVVAVLLFFAVIAGGALVWVGASQDPAPVVSGGGGGGGGLPDILPSGGGENAPDIGITFSGACSPTFDQQVMVIGQPDTLSITSASMQGIRGSLVLSISPSVTGYQALSTQHRVDSGLVINIMAGRSLWTNMAKDAGEVMMGHVRDPISGTMTITQFEPEQGLSDITFNSVVLQHMQDGTLCTLNGRLRTTGTTYSM